MTFTNEPLQHILTQIEEVLQSKQNITFEVLNPDLHRGVYAGTPVKAEGRIYLYRSLRTWMALAQMLDCRMLTPERIPHSPHIRVTFEKIAHNASFHDALVLNKAEKYGTDSPFAQIHKMEEPDFYYYFRQALTNVSLSKRKRVLDLGINRADEFEVIRNMLDSKQYQSMELIGIDHSQSAIEAAQKTFPEPNTCFYTHDINDLDSLNLGRFDLLISIGTLQSPGIAFKPLLMDLVQTHLNKESAIILGFPNARWRDGELVYGAKAPNYTMSEMSLVLNDLMFAKRYLQQKRYRVTMTGRGYLFLTATKIGNKKEKE
ncbi:hypothetical protein MNB_SV-4-1324 [hydrothermal vent metagenome]|uniref:Methyltransferase domain-containing protein n=1 Tax=hydrothermal vent metagenome TaxID=652676 RepID=A0A1W1E926_9ZZZZ